MFPGLASGLGDLAWVRLTGTAGHLDFAAIGGRWALVEKANYPAAQGRMRRLLLGLADLTLIEPKTRRPDLFGRLDLDDPEHGKGVLVSLQARTGATVAEVIIGRSRKDRLGAGNDGVYVRKPGDSQTWLAQGSFDLPRDPADWLDRRIIDIEPQRIASVTLTAADGSLLALRRQSAGGEFAVTDPPVDAALKEAARAAPAAGLAALDLKDVRPAIEHPTPATGTATAEFTTFDGLTVTTRLYTTDNTDWLALHASGEGKAASEAAEINARLAHWVYAIATERAKLLRTRVNDLVESGKGS